jgi:Fic family protein
MDKYAPKWRHGSEREVEEAFRSWLAEARTKLLKLIAAHYRFNTGR